MYEGIYEDTHYEYVAHGDHVVKSYDTGDHISVLAVYAFAAVVYGIYYIGVLVYDFITK